LRIPQAFYPLNPGIPAAIGAVGAPRWEVGGHWARKGYNLSDNETFPSGDEVMRGHYGAIVILASVAVAAGCAGEAPRPQSLPETPKAEKPVETPKVAKPVDLDVPVVYDMRLEPSPLTEKQKKEILGEAALVIP
jgi:hypothetical protein